MSRSTKTATNETSLHWERVGGSCAGIAADYGPWAFRVYAWQPGSYLASARNHETGEVREIGAQAGEVKTSAAGKAFCEETYRELRRDDLAAGITREVD
jgi:hypothetical protein